VSQGPGNRGTHVQQEERLAGRRTPCTAETPVDWANPPHPQSAPAGMGL
jgi:hypothetical protein